MHRNYLQQQLIIYSFANTDIFLYLCIQIIEKQLIHEDYKDQDQIR